MDVTDKILIIDDSRTTRAIVRVYLVGKAYTFLEASDGEAGLALAQKERPNVILTDLQMPRMDGAEVCRRVRSTPGLANTALFIMTSCRQEDELRRAAASGCDAVLAKPIDPAKLLEEIAGVVARRSRVVGVK